MLSLRQIRYFIGVAETGKVSAAANDLNISQSAMTLAIKDLEADLGVSLFERRSTGLSLTREGHQFLNHARNIEGAVTDAYQSVSSDYRSISGHVRLGVTYTLSGYFLFPVLARLQRAHPDLKIEVIESDRLSIERQLTEEKLDFALLLTSNLSNRKTLASETLLRSQRRLWMSSAHPLLAFERISLADVSTEPYVLFHADEAEISAQRYWSKAKLTPNTVFQTTSLEAVRSMVAMGLAVTILSDVVYRPWSLDGGRVETRDLSEKIPSMDVGVVWKRGKKFMDYEKLTREFLANSIIDYSI